ncbi:MAG: beta-lactamase family protein [Gammaproteobacteria bacterium]|nr:beta-lactamase family protein [Gammaproteobacteria bacterium]MYG95941.1 beta-lactamase family protein [Gammaproteobacteria bacterium]
MNPKQHLAAWPLVLILSLASLLAACNPALESTAPVVTEAVVEQVPDLTMAAPEAAGMDSGRLSRLTDAMQGLVDEGRLAGVVTAVVRHGKIVHFESAGYRDMEAGAPMTNDALFRIYSMTKPITGVALMMLYDEGKFRLSDPVEMYIPELSGLQVAAGTDENGELVTEPADHPMTVRELMAHTGGLTYGIFSGSEVDSMYVEADLLNSGITLQEMVTRLGAIPLRQQPGSMWHYSVAVDVQGYLVEVLSGQAFDDFLDERLFGPLGMNDTDFYVPAEKAERFAQIYTYDEEGNLASSEMFGAANDYMVDPVFKSGGGGLVSSTMDYLKFTQMMLNGGELNGVRILSPLTVDLMHRNQLPRGMPDNILGAPGTVFGLDFAVVTDPVEAESFSAGEYYWGGAAGTWFWIDPVEDLIVVGMIQQWGQGLPNVRALSRQLTYQAIMEPLGVN